MPIRILAFSLISLALSAGDPGAGGPTSKAILYGGSATLWPNFANGTGAINNGVGSVTSGTSYTVSPTATTTYTLTVTNATSVSGTVMVTVSPVTMAVLTPSAKTLTAGHTFQFGGGVVSGAVDSTVTWSVIGGATNGTVNATGLYTAPATPGTYTVRATSNAMGTVYQDAAVTVVAAPSVNYFVVE